MTYLLQFLVQLSWVIRIRSEYHIYKIDGIIRYCTPYYDCPPGYQAMPCVANFTTDLCQRCGEGEVQPDFTPMSNNTNTPKCFKPKDSCGAYDVVPRRTLDSTAQCNRFCKCNISQCFYRDPCHCDERVPCDVDKTMDENGDCVPCPLGTSKKEKGCGPCLHIKSLPPDSIRRDDIKGEKKVTTKLASTKKITQAQGHETVTRQSIRNGLITTGKLMSEDANKVTENIRYTFSPIYQDKTLINEEEKDGSQTTLLIAVLISLAVLIIVGTIALLVLVCYRKAQPPVVDVEIPAEGDHLMGHQENGGSNNVIPDPTIKNGKIRSGGNATKSNSTTYKSNPESLFSNFCMHANVQNGEHNLSNMSSLTDEIIKKVDKHEKHLLQAAAQPLHGSSVDNHLPDTSNDFRVVHPSDRNTSDSEWLPKTSDRTFNTQMSVPLDGNKSFQNHSMQKTSSLPLAISNKEVKNTQFDCDEENDRKDNQTISNDFGMTRSNYSRNNTTSLHSHVTVDGRLENSASNIDLSNQYTLDVVSFTPGHTQVTEFCAMPVAQETDQMVAVDVNRVETMTSGLGSSVTDSEVPLQSPMSMEPNEPDKQEYGHLVSVSEGNTESITSRLEQYNFNLAGDKRSIDYHRTEPKHTVRNQDSGVYDSGS